MKETNKMNRSEVQSRSQVQLNYKESNSLIKIW
jgi:hypothetical protein